MQRLCRLKNAINVSLIDHFLIGLFKDSFTKRNMVKNPSWQEAGQLAIYKHSQGVELRTTKNNIS